MTTTTTNDNTDDDDGTNSNNNNNNNKSHHPSCAIRVADRWHTWQPGKILVFDDSFEHEVVNDTDQVRGVLLLRFWHPLLLLSSVSSSSSQSLFRALEQVCESQRLDQMRRCNPPLLESEHHHVAVRRRGMEDTRCAHCGQTGYTSIRVGDQNYHSDNGEREFYCCCGYPIADE